MPNTPDITVIGAGIIGATCALQLARQGLSVQVLDRQATGMGASFGNAGHLATEQVFPIADLSILKRVPAMLLDPMGPLRLDWRYLPRALPWFTRLLLNLRPAPFARTVEGLRRLNQASLPAWQRLLESIGHNELLHLQGSLLMYEKPESQAAVLALQQRMSQQQVAVEPWDAGRLHSMAPQLHQRAKGGLFFPETGHFIDPYITLLAVVEAARQAGVHFVQNEVLGGQVMGDGVVLHTAQGPLASRRVLLATGAHSAGLAKRLAGLQVPLDTERGYHLMLPCESGRLPFAVTSFERRFIMTPMAGGLRLAGTVEFAGLKRPPNHERAWQLLRLSQGLFEKDLNAEGATPWMGFRPSLPDSLPVIDQACAGRVLLAFGHQHLGLTQAAVTAELVGALATGKPAPAAFRADRFQPGAA